MVLTGCQFKFSSDDEVNASSLVKIERYDRLEYRYLTTGDFSALQQMNTEYPVETRTLMEDVVKIGSATEPDINTKFLKFYQDTILQSLITAVEAEYANMDDLNRQLNVVFAKLKHTLPDVETPRVYAQISALDQSIVVGTGIIGISLDKYLGENYPLYKKFYSPQQRSQMSREYIVSDCLTFYLMSLYPMDKFEARPQKERDLYMGKIQWVVNQTMGRKVFDNGYVDAVASYMRHGSGITYEELLRLTDFTEFKVRGE
ncbi:hypothetical protein JCM15908A_06510 [Prevotella dentasini JCM 15908]